MVLRRGEGEAGRPVTGDVGRQLQFPALGGAIVGVGRSKNQIRRERGARGIEGIIDLRLQGRADVGRVVFRRVVVANHVGVDAPVQERETQAKVDAGAGGRLAGVSVEIGADIVGEHRRLLVGGGDGEPLGEIEHRAGGFVGSPSVGVEPDGNIVGIIGQGLTGSVDEARLLKDTDELRREIARLFPVIAAEAEAGAQALLEERTEVLEHRRGKRLVVIFEAIREVVDDAGKLRDAEILAVAVLEVEPGETALLARRAAVPV